MKRRKTIIGICALCALALSAIAAQGASAQTAVTCSPFAPVKPFIDALCRENIGSGGFAGHEAFAGETSITLSNSTIFNPIAKLKSVQSGVTLELQSAEVTGTGHMRNVEEGGVMFASGAGVITFRVITVTAPAGKGCSVVGGKVVTNNLSATTKGLTNELKFSPASGETFAEFTVSGCSVTALNHAYTLKGSVKGKTDGVLTAFTHSGSTEQKTLSLSGQNAGLEGNIVIKGENGNGLALT